jgi:hypothetical protein
MNRERTVITEPPDATPAIHLNGTSAKSLRESLKTAYCAAAAVLESLRECRPNGRDYYPQGPAAMDAATEQAAYRESLVDALRDSIEREIGRIDAQADPRPKATP